MQRKAKRGWMVDSIPMYGYVGGSPLSLIDPTGEAAQALPLIPLGAEIGAGVACYVEQCGEIISVAYDAAKEAWDRIIKGMAAHGNQADSAIQYAYGRNVINQMIDVSG